MAAGLGFKTFTTGEVLTAADTNGYLMQGINVFASTAARDAAITSPQEGQFAFTKDTNGLWYYDGAAWVASGATGDIEGVTAGVGITGGGTSGTVTITNDMATTITAAGDIVVGTGSGTYDNLPIGTTAQVLTADTTVSPYKVKWATPAGGGGKILQVIQNTATTTVTTTSKAVWIQQAITPSSATSRVLITVCATVAYTPNTNAIASGDIRDVTNGTNLILFDAGVQSSTAVTSNFSQNFIHSPATTSSITYALRMGPGSGGTTSVNSATNAYTIILMEIGA